MPVTVKCRCGKATQRFDKMNPGEIETFDCPRCDGEAPKSKESKPRPPAALNSPYGRAPKKLKEQAAQAEAEQQPVQKEEPAPAQKAE
jgi:hypothetical protein